MSYASVVAADTPLLWWKMDEASGTTYADSSGNSHPGTKSGTATQGVDGPLNAVANGGKALQFAGAGAVAGAIDLSAQNKLTIEFWVKWPSSTSDQMLIEFTANGQTTAGGFSISNTGTNHTWKVWLGTTLFTQYNVAIDQPSWNNWHHVVLLLDRTANQGSGAGAGAMRLFVDAVSRNRNTSGFTAVGGNFANSTLYVGARTANTMFATATVAQVAIYSGLFDQAKVDAHYTAGTNLDWVHPGIVPFDPVDLFPNGSFWTDVLPDDAPLHTSSSQWANNLMTQLGLDPADPGRTPWSTAIVGNPGLRGLAYTQGTPPIYVVPDDQPLVSVALGEVLEGWSWPRIDNFHEVMMKGVPIPDHCWVDASGDYSLVIYQPGTQKYWEMWVTQHYPGVEPPGVAGNHQRSFEWRCYGGGHFRDLTVETGTYRDRFDTTGSLMGLGTNFKYEDYFDGHTATSLPISAGLVTPEEWNSDGPIEHALHLEVGNAWTEFVFPAHRGDGQMGFDFIPEGAWVRLDPDLDIDTHFPLTNYLNRKINMLAKAMQKYGAFITDKTGVGVALRMRNLYSYFSEGPGIGSIVLQPGADGFIREWDVMGYFPWPSLQVIDPDWVRDRWGTPVAPPAALSTLVDPFDGATVDLTRWPSTSNTTVSAGQAHIATNTSYSGGMNTYPSFYTLTGGSVFAEVVSFSTASGSEAALGLFNSADTNCFVEFIWSGNLIADYKKADGSRVQVASASYNPATHRWWKIRESGGNVIWETSADGLTWAQFASLSWATTGWTADRLDSMQVKFFAGSFGGLTGLADLVLDNVNVVPSGPPPPPPQLPVLAVSPANLSFTASEGGASPSPKTATITNAGGGDMLDIIVSDDAAWLTVTPSSPTVPVTLSIWPTVASLTAGTYTGTVTVTATTPGTTGSPKTINVSFVVSPPPSVGPESKYVKINVMIMDPENGTYESGFIDADALFDGLTPKDPLP